MIKIIHFLQNATASEKLSNLPKRQASASAAAAAAAASNLLGANLWDAIPVTDLDAHSCEAEAFDYGHVHSSGLVVHEFFCELRKLWHYFLIIVRNLRAGLTLGPLIAEEVIVEGHGILHLLLHRIPRLLFTLIRAPHHLLILPDIIRDAVPFHSVHHALGRLIRVVLKVRHFVHDLLWGNVRYVLGHFFHLHHLGLNLRDRLLQLRLTRLHYLHGLGSVLPCENVVGGPIAATATSAAAAAAATATATATATAADGGAIAPDYHSSLAELLSSFRGIYDGYYASGIPHLIRTGVTSISTSTTYSKVTSHLSNVPTYWTNIRSYLSRLPSLINNYAPQGTTVTAASAASASSSVGGSVASPIISPVVGPLIRPAPLVPLAPIAPVESVSSSASASTTVTETQPLVSAPLISAPLISAVPTVISPVVSSSGAASAAATAAATAAAAASAASASPVVSSYQTAVPCAPLVSETIENTVSESSSSSVAVASPEVVVPGISAGNAAAAASAAASVSSASDIGSAYRPRPVFGPLSGYSPILPSVSAPASAASASSSASVSSGGNLIDQYRGLDWNLGGRLPRIRQRIRPVILPAVAPSSAAAATAAASSAASGGAAAASSASSASTLSSGGLNFLLPREHIIGAIGHDYLLPGDLVSVTLRNKAILIGRVLDATSPISFSFLRPKLRAALFRHGGRIWNLSPWDFRDPECIRKFNSPALLRYAL